ncbi:MD-2-related lipid-recognition protein-like [Neodiprion fabricii]|uniref:MD-2-related lipid-recognition protein-like n=1 Tax=Neodiprion fabricii TaxID=2872261 RepID=UPI001ED9480C|nr:MD-2-related lipid-recognition protein-like [Neodiprion fabricii]
MKTRHLISPLVLIAVITLATPIFAEVVVWRPCSYSDLSENLPTNCTVHEVRVKPCKEATSKKPCRIKRGQEASISFDFTPNFSSDNLQSSAYWANDMQDIGFPGMNTNACGNTACPTTSGTKQTYSYELAISKSFPVRIFNVKWKLWNEEAQECCILFQIKLTK